MACPQLPSSSDGISLEALRLFLSEHAGKDFASDARWEAVCDHGHPAAAGRDGAFEELTVAQVSILLLGYGVSGPTYAQRLRRSERGSLPPLAAPATAYVVYCWDDLFVRFAEALLSHFEGAANADGVYVWICAHAGWCALHERRTDAPPPRNRCCAGDFCQGDRDSPGDPVGSTQAASRFIQRVGRTLLLLDSWREPTPMSRLWCLWEVLCTIDGGGVLEIALSKQERLSFMQALLVRHGVYC
jgi:hypothetical protein